MNFRASAFLTRSLRQESRFVSHHVLRAGLALLILLLFLAQVIAAASRMGAGGAFAKTVLLCVYWFLTLIGTIYFSTAIVEEKEEETLPLLRMTGASAFAILTGKSLPRLAVAFLFLLVISPFLMLSVTLGGVLQYGLASAVISILVYAVMLSQIGLLASVICRSAPRAFTLVAVMWILLEFSHWWTWIFSETAFAVSGLSRSMDAFDVYSSREWSTGNWGQMCMLWLHIKLGAASEWLDARVLLGNLSTKLMAIGPGEIWDPVNTFQVCVAAVSFALSWLLFDTCTSRAVGEGKASTVAPEKKVSRRRSSRVAGPALVWKSWRYLTGGVPWLIIRAFVLPIFIVAVITAVIVAFDGTVELDTIGGVLIFFGICILIINTARLLGRVFNDEIHQKTLHSLLMLPRPRYEILLSLLAGLIPAIVTACSTLFVGFVLASSNRDFIPDLVDVMSEAWTYQLLIWAVATFHLGVLVSVYCRYGGMLMAVAFMWFVMPVIFWAVVGALAVIAGGPGWIEDFFQWVVPLLLIPCTAGLCIATYWPILRRIEALGAK